MKYTSKTIHITDTDIEYKYFSLWKYFVSNLFFGFSTKPLVNSCFNTYESTKK